MGKARKRRRAEIFGNRLDEYEEDSLQDVSLSVKAPTPDGIEHYERFDEVPLEIRNYWKQRFWLFSRYNQGIWMTHDLWFGVTQEDVARKIASHVHAAVPPNRRALFDVMAGGGGNLISFAQQSHWRRVYGIEKDERNLECAKHNAELYGVHEKITWFRGDCFEMLNTHGIKELAASFGVLFCSPPWGGPKYKADEVFDLEAMQPYSLKHLYTELKKFSEYVILYLPRTSDLRQISELLEEGQKAQVVHYCTQGASRALCVYLGPFKKIHS
ncbi:MAG: hypothetical protein Q9160_001427 [Pyrenula sp. 1 TL-2023]